MLGRKPRVKCFNAAYRGQGKTKDQMEILAVDRAMLLDTTKIMQAWENETPEAIVRWSVRQTGLPVGRIDAVGVILPHFVASKRPVWQVAAQAEHSCSEAFGLDMSGWTMWLGASLRRIQTGQVQGYGLVMAVSLIFLILWAFGYLNIY